jgi:hypothetical protein
MDRGPRSYRRKTNTLENIYDWSQQLIEAADRKVTTLLLIDTVIISFSATWNLRECCAHVKVVMMLAIVLAVVSSIMFLLTIFPRATHYATDTVLYYRGILKSSRDEYASTMLELTDEELSKDYLNTIYVLASIQMRKFRYLKLGSQFLVVSLFMLGLSFILSNI